MTHERLCFSEFFRMGKLTNNWGDNKKKLCLSNDNEQVNLETLVTVLKLSRKHLHKNQPMPSHSHTVVVHYKQRETHPLSISQFKYDTPTK